MDFFAKRLDFLDRVFEIWSVYVLNISYLLHEEAIGKTRFHLYDLLDTILELTEADQYLIYQKVYDFVFAMKILCGRIATCFTFYKLFQEFLKLAIDVVFIFVNDNLVVEGYNFSLTEGFLLS